MAETGVVASGPRAGETVVRIDPKYFRPAEARAHAPVLLRIACMCLHVMHNTKWLTLQIRRHAGQSSCCPKGFTSAKLSVKGVLTARKQMMSCSVGQTCRMGMQLCVG